MTWNEFNKRLVAALTDDYSEVLEGEEREEWIRKRKEYKEHKTEMARQEKETMDHWFEREEYVNGNWLKRLWLRLLYAIKDTHGEGKLPDAVAREIARYLLPNIIEFFESDEGKKAFEEWKQSKNNAQDKSDIINNKKDEV